MFALLDTIKEMKSSLQNDFTTYNRFAIRVETLLFYRHRRILASKNILPIVSETELQTFLSKKNYIFSKLRDEINKPNSLYLYLFIYIYYYLIYYYLIDNVEKEEK